jgi:hypothetical protein
MVANRACAASSKLYCHEQWLREDVRIADTEGLELHHLYRAMDFLEAHGEFIEERLCHRLVDPLNLDVDVVFYETTSLHFEIDEPDEAEGMGNQASRFKTPPSAEETRKERERVCRCAADRHCPGRDPRRLAGTPLCISRQSGCSHGGPGQGGPARLAAQPLPVRGRCWHGLRGQS